MSTPDLHKLVAQLEDGEVDAVLDVLSEAVQTEPAHVAAHVVYARALAASGRDQDALESWRTAFLLCPDSPVIRRGLRRCAAHQAEAAMMPALEAVAAGATIEPLVAKNEVAGYQDLDVLIQDLESARIVPDPDVQPARPEDIEVDVEDVVSETLARIYANQRFYEEASRVYDKLAVQQPERSEEFHRKALEIRKKLDR